MACLPMLARKPYWNVLNGLGAQRTAKCLVGRQSLAQTADLTGQDSAFQGVGVGLRAMLREVGGDAGEQGWLGKA